MSLIPNTASLSSKYSNINSDENHHSLKRKGDSLETPDLKRARTESKESTDTIESIADSHFKLYHVKKPIDLKKCRALIVDDTKLQRIMLVAKLKNIGFSPDNLHVAEDGQIGVAKFKDEQFDVVFMDIEMPNLDGFNASNQIRIHEKHKNQANNIPIISITSTTEGDRKENLHLNKISIFLPKETSPTTILNTLNEYFDVE